MLIFTGKILTYRAYGECWLYVVVGIFVLFMSRLLLGCQDVSGMLWCTYSLFC